MSEAKDAAKRLKIDLEIDGMLVEPVRETQPIALFLTRSSRMSY